MIRVCTFDDLAAVTTLNKEDLGYPETTLSLVQDNFRTVEDNPDHVIFVATHEGIVVGYVHAHVYRSIYHEPSVNILGIAVRDTVRGHGYGKALLNEVETWAKAHTINMVRLNSNVIRTKAHAFYEKCGYSSYKSQKHFSKII